MVTLVARYVGGGELGRTEIPQLLDRLRNLRLDELRLTDSTETLAEQRLDRLDAGAVIGDGDLLSEAVATLGTGPGGSCLSGGAGRGLEQMVLPCAAADWTRSSDRQMIPRRARGSSERDGDLSRH